MNLKQAAKLRRFVRRLVNAEVNNSWWKGGGDPDDWPAIEEELKKAKKALDKFISELTVKETGPPAQPECIDGT